MDWWSAMTQEQQFSVLSTAATAIAAAVVGGLISLIASLLVFRVTKKAEERRAEADLMALRNRNARIGLAKLVAITNQIYSMEKAIDKQFAEANEDGYLVAEPSLAIRSMVSGLRKIDRLGAEELEFLFYINSGNLVTDIQLLQNRADTHIAMIREYNDQRNKLDKIFEAGLDPETDLTGVTASSILDERTGRLAELKIAALNVLLGDIVVKLQRDLSEALEIAESYRAAAVKVFGDKFPKISPRKEEHDERSEPQFSYHSAKS